jgi:hypothetical protein
MYVKAKMVLFETVPLIKERGMGKSYGGDKFQYDIFDAL